MTVLQACVAFVVAGGCATFFGYRLRSTLLTLRSDFLNKKKGWQVLVLVDALMTGIFLSCFLLDLRIVLAVLRWL